MHIYCKLLKMMYKQFGPLDGSVITGLVLIFSTMTVT